MSTGGGMVQAGWPAAVAGGVVWLGSMLARGATTAGTIFKGANGVQVRLAQLWPLVKKYGPYAVAGGLGISAQQLATLLEQSPKTGGGRRGRGRGISSRDVKTTRRTLKTIKKLYNMMPTRRPSYGGYRPYYARGRR